MEFIPLDDYLAPANDEQKNILDCLTHIVESGSSESLIVIYETDDENVMLTDLDRNDIIVGRLEMAKQNFIHRQSHEEVN